jgi:hypothetical protein
MTNDVNRSFVRIRCPIRLTIMVPEIHRRLARNMSRELRSQASMYETLVRGPCIVDCARCPRGISLDISQLAEVGGTKGFGKEATTGQRLSATAKWSTWWSAAQREGLENAAFAEKSMSFSADCRIDTFPWTPGLAWLRKGLRNLLKPVKRRLRTVESKLHSLRGSRGVRRIDEMC